MATSTTKEVKYNRFDGGFTENQRDTSGYKVWYAENVLLSQGLVTQTTNNKSENSDSYSSAYCVVKTIDTGGTVYGLGQDNATNKDVSLYSTATEVSDTWALVTNGTIATSLLKLADPFLLYNPTDGYIYLDGGNNYIARWASGVMTSTYVAITGGMYGGINWQGNMYGYQGTGIYKITTAPAVTLMISVPAEQTIKQMIPHGNYMAIICSSATGISKMYLWDGVTTTTFSDIVEIGRGTVTGGNILDGDIYAVIGTDNYKILRVMRYAGSGFQSVYNYYGRGNRAGTSLFTSPASTVKTYSGHLYFIAVGTRPDSTNTAIYEASLFRYGRTNPDSPYSLSCFKTFSSIKSVGGIAATNNGSNDFVIIESAVSQVQGQRTFAFIYGLAGANTSTCYEQSTTYNTTEDTVANSSGVLELPTFNAGNAHQQKELKGVAVTTEFLPTAGTVVLKYRKDEELTWTTIYTNTTDSAVSHSATNIESTGVNLPTFKEIQFRIEFSGNAKLTGFKFKYEELEESSY